MLYKPGSRPQLPPHTKVLVHRHNNWKVALLGADYFLPKRCLANHNVQADFMWWWTEQRRSHRHHLSAAECLLIGCGTIITCRDCFFSVKGSNMAQNEIQMECYQTYILIMFRFGYTELIKLYSKYLNWHKLLNMDTLVHVNMDEPLNIAAMKWFLACTCTTEHVMHFQFHFLS